VIRSLRAFIWLRWRLLANGLRGGRRRDTIEQISRSLQLFMPIILGVMSLGIVVARASWRRRRPVGGQRTMDHLRRRRSQPGDADAIQPPAAADFAARAARRGGGASLADRGCSTWCRCSSPWRSAWLSATVRCHAGGRTGAHRQLAALNALIVSHQLARSRSPPRSSRWSSSPRPRCPSFPRLPKNLEQRQREGARTGGDRFPWKPSIGNCRLDDGASASWRPPVLSGLRSTGWVGSGLVALGVEFVILFALSGVVHRQLLTA
jgi:hypothetical protein